MEMVDLCGKSRVYVLVSHDSNNAPLARTYSATFVVLRRTSAEVLLEVHQK